MNRWSVETRNRVLALAAGTAALLGLIWVLLINTLEESLKLRTGKIDVVQRQLQIMRTGIERGEQYQDIIRRSGLLLSASESQMAQGDVYRWMNRWLRELITQGRHKVSITAFPPPQEGQLIMPPRVPYKAGTFSITGRARYHDFGAFLADLENSSPFIQLRFLALEATTSGVTRAGEEDELMFRMDFVTLIKSAPLTP